MEIPFYYKEIIVLAARESGLEWEFISDIHKNSLDILHDLYLSAHVVQYVIKAQDKIIRKIADNGCCVIVHTPRQYRINRVMETYGDFLAEAKRNIRRSDKARGAYYRHISSKRWEDGSHYNVMIGSSIGVGETTEMIFKYVFEYTDK